MFSPRCSVLLALSYVPRWCGRFRSGRPGLKLRWLLPLFFGAAPLAAQMLDSPVSYPVVLSGSIIRPDRNPPIPHPKFFIGELNGTKIGTTGGWATNATTMMIPGKSYPMIGIMAQTQTS